MAAGAGLSARNGAPAETNEDRGNAVLSTEPLSVFTAIELPFERQRRVAIAATVSGSTRAGGAWALRLASVHLESLGLGRLPSESREGSSGLLVSPSLLVLRLAQWRVP